MKQDTWKSIRVSSAKCTIAAAGLLLAGTSLGHAAECEDPDTLTFSIIPTEETSQEVNLYKPIIDRLKVTTGKQIEFYIPTSYASVIEAMLSGWVDIGVHGPYSYVIARGKDETLDVFATYAKKKGHLQEEGPGYKAVLIGRKDSGLDSIAKIKGKVIGLTDPASTSGNLLPRVSFTKEIGGDLETYFRKVVYTGGHDLSTMAVHEGKVDAAFVATHRFDNVVDRGLVNVEDFNILWASKAIPQDPFVYRGKLCEELKAKIADTFLNLHDVPEAKAFLDNVKSARFVAVSNSDYDIIRDLKAAKDAKKKAN